jgi:putative Mn2+ efflux pump MntP
MQWITIILLGIAANLDNLVVSLAYSVKQTKIPFVSNLTIAGVSMTVTYVSVIAGNRIIEYISPDTASLIGSLLLCAIGLWTIIPHHPDGDAPEKNPALIDRNGDKIVSFREALMLGVILSANCLATGIGIGANGISALGAVLSIGFFSLVTIGASNHCGKLLSRTPIGKYPSTIAGGLLIFIGIFEIFV